MPSTELIRHVDKDRKDTFINQYNGNKLLFKTIETVLNEWIEESYRASEKIEVHNYSDFATFMADQNGYRRALKKVRDLLPEN